MARGNDVSARQSGTIGIALLDGSHNLPARIAAICWQPTGTGAAEFAPEWEHINFEAPVWGLAHCRAVESARAPAEFDGQRKNSTPGSQEIFGYMYLYDPKGANEITARFLVKSPDAVEAMKIRWQRRLNEIKANIDEVAPGVVEISLPRGWPTSRESFWSVVWSNAGDDGP